MGSHSEDSLDITNKMYKLLIASVLAVATALPIEDTAEVQEAKAVFNPPSPPLRLGSTPPWRPSMLTPRPPRSPPLILPIPRAWPLPRLLSQPLLMTPLPEVWPLSRLPPLCMRSLLLPPLWPLLPPSFPPQSPMPLTPAFTAMALTAWSELTPEFTPMDSPMPVTPTLVSPWSRLPKRNQPEPELNQ